MEQQFNRPQSQQMPDGSSGSPCSQHFMTLRSQANDLDASIDSSIEATRSKNAQDFMKQRKQRGGQ